MSLTDLVANVNNPTFRESYVVNLIDVLFFFLISLIIRYIINKKCSHQNQKNKGNIKISSKTMLIIIFVITIMLNEKVYAEMAMTTYGLDIITIMINFIGIYIANFVIELITNHEGIKKTKFFEIFSETVIENIIFNTVLIICIMATNVVGANYMIINIIITVIITSLYKVIKLLLNKYIISKKILIAILYFLILFAFGILTKCNIRENYYSENGIFLKREVEEWKKGKYRIEDNISIEYSSNN